MKSITLLILHALASLEVNAPAELLLIKEPAIVAKLIEISQDGTVRFEVDSEVRAFKSKGIIRWSHPKPNARHAEMVLTCGSRIVLADSWTGVPSWRLESKSVVVQSKLFGEIVVPYELVHAILSHAPQGEDARANFLRSLGTVNGSKSVYFKNGDRWEADSIETEWKKGNVVKLQTSVSEGQRAFPETSVAAIWLNPLQEAVHSPRTLVLGTQDGSMIVVQDAKADNQGLALSLPSSIVLTGSDIHAINYLRSFVADCRFLSDLPRESEKQIPFFDRTWPICQDRNVLGEVLRVNGKRYTKGLGVATASRLTYLVVNSSIGKPFERFTAKVAIDDTARSRGSVVFRVYTQVEGKWKLAYESPIVYGRQEPKEISVPLGKSTRVALLTDFAERGDECDYANWLEARFE